MLAAERLPGDDTTVPVLASGKTVTGRLWTYMRDDRSFAGPAPPAAFVHYSRGRAPDLPSRRLTRNFAGRCLYQLLHPLCTAARTPDVVLEAAFWSHRRCKFFELAELARSQLAVEAVRRIDAIFAAERLLNGNPPGQRLATRQMHFTHLVTDLEVWMHGARGKLSRHNDVAKAVDYMLKRWDAFRRFLDDGRICLSNNAA